MLLLHRPFLNSSSVWRISASRPSAPSSTSCRSKWLLFSTTTPCSNTKITTTFHLPDASQSPLSMPLTKIVATIGPTSEQEIPLRHVVQAGMKIMRLNFSHATPDEVELRCTNLIKAQTTVPDWRAILLDTKGPEIRAGKLAHDSSGHETVTLQAGNNITLHTSEQWRNEGTSTNLFIDYQSLCKALKINNKVLLDDGAVSLTVQSIDAANQCVTCVVDNTGDLRSRPGVNLPLADTGDLPALSDKDKADILYGMTHDIDFVAASFVQSAQGVRDIRAHIRACAQQLEWDIDQPLPLIVSKIESAAALQNFDSILEESDGIMVARGDLGVEIPLPQVTNAQKEMVAACNAVGKPVLVATQMLESMSKSPRPTRAEVSDVTNAVYDGADAVMLSGETAKGKYPTQTVQFMKEIILSAERYACSGALGHPHVQPYLASPKNRHAALAAGAVRASQERDCAAILVSSRQGELAKLVAAFRPRVPILAFVPVPKLAKQLQLWRGIYPIVFPSPADDHHHKEEGNNPMIHKAKELGYIQAHQEVVVISMEDDEVGRTAHLKLVTVP